MDVRIISFIIPDYNIEAYVCKCVDIILPQTYTNFEIFLADVEPTDGSEEICDEYAQKDNRIKVIHKANGGVSSARNVGLNTSKGRDCPKTNPLALRNRL